MRWFPPASAPAIACHLRLDVMIGAIRPIVLLAVFAATVGCRKQGAADPANDDAAVPGVAAGWTAEPADGGTAKIRFNHTTVATFAYRFFGPRWGWVESTIEDRGNDAFGVRVEELGLEISGRTESAGDGVLRVVWELEAARAIEGIEGGGIEFELVADTQLLGPGLAAPEVLEGERGFSWNTGRGPIRVEFEPAIAAVYFERGNAKQIRCMLVGKSIAAGKSSVAMTISLPPGGTILPSLGRRYAPVDPATWAPATLAWDRAPVDLSVLTADDRPAGKRGPVRVKGDALVLADGTPVRFWGANVAAYGIFQGDHDAIAAQAKKLAQMGFNLVRLHHHDSPWVDPNILDTSSGSTRKLRDDALERVDWWVKCLQDEGIYMWLDLHVGRKFLPGDGIGAYDELEDGDARGYNYVDSHIAMLMDELARGYLDRKNRFTGRRYADDPGVMGVLVTNENDVTHHFGNLMVEGAGHPVHQRMLEAAAARFAERSGIDPGPLQPWAPGPTKVVLNEIEARFDLAAIAKLRKLGWRGPIATTNLWGDDRLSSLPALTTGDVIDVHSYGGPEQLSTNPRHEASFVSYIASAQVAGMPLVVTEWNVPAPTRDRFVAPLWLAGTAALQGWDAPMLYVYLQHPVAEPTAPSEWSSYADAGVMAMMPAAALLYRQGHVRQSPATVRVELSREQLYHSDLSAYSSAAIRTLAERSRVEIGLPDLPELDWDGRVSGRPDAIVVEDPSQDFLDADATAIVSETGELSRDWARGVHTIDTARTQAAQGWIGGQTIALGDVEIAVTTPKASVAISSLDGAPIRTSKKLLLTVVAQVSTSPGGGLPLLAEPVAGRIAIASDAKTLVLEPLLGAAAQGTSAVPLAAKVEGGRHVLTLPGRSPTHWFLVRPR
jgi:hypothetical protein